MDETGPSQRLKKLDAAWQQRAESTQEELLSAFENLDRALRESVAKSQSATDDVLAQHQKELEVRLRKWNEQASGQLAKRLSIGLPRLVMAWGAIIALLVLGTIWAGDRARTAWQELTALEGQIVQLRDDLENEELKAASVMVRQDGTPIVRLKHVEDAYRATESKRWYVPVLTAGNPDDPSALWAEVWLDPGRPKSR